MHDKYLNNLSFSSIACITLELAKNNKQQIHIKPYLDSSLLIPSLNRNSLQSPEHHKSISQYFKPLAIDYYSLFRRDKLEFIIDRLSNGISEDTLYLKPC